MQQVSQPFARRIYTPPFRLLTVYQPWADFLTADDQVISRIAQLNPDLADRLPKDIENRGYGTQFRGTVLIHAAQTIDLLALARFGLEDLEFARSAVVGVARLDSVVTNSHSYWAQRDCTQWVMSHPRRLVSGVPCAGFQGAGRSPRPEVLDAVLDLLDDQPAAA